jgi:subtilase family serine protease
MKATSLDIRKPLLVGALFVSLMTLVAVTPAQAARNVVRPPVLQLHERAICSHTGRTLGCDAHVVTNRQGQPLRFSRPALLPVQPLATAGTTAYAPSAIHTGYQLPWYSSVRQTIALVVAFHHPYAKYDLDQFNSGFGLGFFPTCSSTITTGCFDQVNENGYHSGWPQSTPAGSLWDIEASMDIEVAHMMCLNCKILLVEAGNIGELTHMAIAENTAARLGATEISNSYGMSESKVDGTAWSYRSAWNHPGIAITASAGDDNYGVEFPADLNTVVAVGGTNLFLNSDGSYNSESVWGSYYGGKGTGTGSGCSSFVDSYTSAAYWQSAVANWSLTGCGARRGVADVAADASCSTAVWVFTTLTSSASSNWQLGCGTSLASPIIAGVYALAGNAASVTWAAQIPYQHSAYLHDVTSGYNGSCGTIMCRAVSGYDGPTGLGTPRGLGAF